MRFPFLFCTLLLLLANQAVAASSDLSRLVHWMTGTFTTADQARGDQNFRDVTLHIIPIWSDRTDGTWLYAEQALTDGLDHPYRQFIYQLTAPADGRLEVRLFDLPDPIAVTGAWKNPALLATLTPANLVPQQGATLVLHGEPDGSFKGRTEGKGYPSTLRGASYATSELMVSEKLLTTWDRGYNANGSQVWGSIHGEYQFKRAE